MRQTASLFGNDIREALHLEQAWEKSEQLPSYLPFFVGSELIGHIHNNSNQLIVGRRGTGKTHLLGAFSEHIGIKCPSELAILISIMELGQTPPLPYTESPEFAAKRMARDKFEQFLRAFYYKLLNQVTMFAQNKLRPHIEERKWKQLHKEIDDRLLLLMEAIELGREYSVSKTRRHIRRDTFKTKKGLGAEADVCLKNILPSVDAKVSLGGHSDRAGEENVETTMESIIAVDLHDVRDLLSRLIECLGLGTLYILIDEWMEIDKNTPSSIQANFAQLLKMTFFNHSHISVKIASVWHETTLYSKGDLAQSQGLQLGQDIQMGPDLDSAFFSSEDAVFSFCKNTLFKRLSHASETLKCLEVDGEINDVFITEIFDNRPNFRAFLAATHGIPRDMMKIFFKCSLRIRCNFNEDCIDFHLISAVAMDAYKTIKRKSIDPGSTAQMMLNRIDKYLEETGRRLFLIENSQVKTCGHLRELVDDEIIHRIPSSMTPRCVRNTHKAFHIDYGNMVDWITSKRGDISEILNHSVVPCFAMDFDSTFQSYVLDAVAVAKDRITCSHCGNGFMIDNPVYKKAKICPRCATETE